MEPLEAWNPSQTFHLIKKCASSQWILHLIWCSENNTPKVICTGDTFCLFKKAIFLALSPFSKGRHTELLCTARNREADYLLPTYLSVPAFVVGALSSLWVQHGTISLFQGQIGIWEDWSELMDKMAGLMQRDVSSNWINKYSEVTSDER